MSRGTSLGEHIAELAKRTDVHANVIVLPEGQVCATMSTTVRTASATPPTVNSATV
jgi:hypothetical protein